jgi:hypothetical protein
MKMFNLAFFSKLRWRCAMEMSAMLYHLIYHRYKEVVDKF